MTPSQVAVNLQPIASINIPTPISWADEERDLTAWQGNELQTAALEKLYELTEKVNKCDDEQIKKDWTYLQASDHLYYMCTKFFSDGIVHAYFNPYSTPYEAFMNYMNVLSDFEIRINRINKTSEQDNEMLEYDELIREKEEIIKKQAAEIESLKKKLARLQGTKNKKASKKTKYSNSSASKKQVN